jgi:hypothetical protein
MKFKLVALLVLIQSFSFSLAPHRANALMGITSFNPEMAVLGGFFAVAGAGVLSIGVSRMARHEGSPHTNFWIAVQGAAALVGGIVFLEEGSPSSLQFQEISLEQQHRLGISSTEYEIYQAELEEVKAAWNTAEASVRALEHPTLNQSKALFLKELGTLSAETRKIMRSLVKDVLENS